MSRQNIKEKILYLRLKQKDKEAFIQAYDLYLDDIYRFIYFKVSNKEEAEDLTSSVFLKAWDHIQNNSLTDYKTLKALFYKIARNLVIDHYRQKAGKQDISYDSDENYFELADENQDVARQAEVLNDFKIVSDKMFDLKDEYREIIVLKYINELSISEIALIMDKSHGNIRVLIYRALNALRTAMEQASPLSSQASERAMPPKDSKRVSKK